MLHLVKTETGDNVSGKDMANKYIKPNETNRTETGLNLPGKTTRKPD